MSKKLSKKEAIDKLWRMGNLEWKLRGIQKEMRLSILDKTIVRPTFLVSRRSGKSFTLCTVATEVCLSTPNSVVKYVCPKQRMVKTIVKPIMRVILEDCPEDLKPIYMEADKVYRFPNGSEIQFAGSDNGNIENLRGGFAHLCLLDEAGFISDLNYAVLSVLSPTTKTVNGRLVLASTPSREPDHEFMSDFVSNAALEGNLIKYTLYDNPMFTKRIIDETIAEYPLGIDDPQFRREYLCETAIDSELQVIPEFTEELEKDIVKQSDIPPYYDAYVSCDPAFVDMTILLFGYYDFMRDVLVIADELALSSEIKDITTIDIADGIARKEKKLFKNPLTGEITKPTLRVMDNNMKILISDLYHEHGLEFIATAKDNKEAQINKVRMMLRQGKIEINPQCINLRHHLRSARWNKSRTGFQRVKGSSDGKYKANHADAVDALVYLVRNYQPGRNPYPDDFFQHSGGEDWFNSRINKPQNSQVADNFMKSITNIKDK